MTAEEQPNPNDGARKPPKPPCPPAKAPPSKPNSACPNPVYTHATLAKIAELTPSCPFIIPAAAFSLFNEKNKNDKSKDEVSIVMH